MKNGLPYLLIFVGILFVFTGCHNDFIVSESSQNQENSTLLKTSTGLLKLSYDIYTSSDFVTDFESLSPLDLSHVVPKSEKERIEMILMDDGGIQMSIRNIEFDEKIRFNSYSTPSDAPEIDMAKIGGGMYRTYDKNGELLDEFPFEFPKETKLVEQIKKKGQEFIINDAGLALAMITGQPVNMEFEELLDNMPKTAGVSVQEMGDDYVAVRSKLESDGLDKELQSVVIFDKKEKRAIGARLYDRAEKLLEATYYGYSEGRHKNIERIKKEVVTVLPSGREVIMESYSKIENFEISLN